MSALNGTALLIYCNGKLVALQKGISIALNIELPDATNKESANWAEHILGDRDAKIDFNALGEYGLIGDKPSVVMGAKALMNYILNSQSIIIEILGLGTVIVGEGDISSLSFDAPEGNTMTLSGSMKVNGPLHFLNAAQPNLITNPAAISNYDIHTVSGTALTPLYDSTGSVYCVSNEFTALSGSSYKLICFLTKASGQFPSVSLDDGYNNITSNVATFVEGLNIITLLCTGSWATSRLRITNGGSTELTTSSIYLLKV